MFNMLHCPAATSLILDGSSSGKPSAELDAAAEMLARFCTALQSNDGLDDAQLASLVTAVPSLLDEDPPAVRAKLDAIAAQLGCSLGAAAQLVTRVPAAWNRY
jgi:hypothetical protein